MKRASRGRVAVAMSGGVDSSVAAALLVRQGYEVIGLTMCFNLQEPRNARRPSCCGLQGIDDAARVAGVLGIRHYTLSMRASLEEYVIRDFLRQYLAGMTPNPCVRCNQFVKFKVLLSRARALGASFLATGHYARIVRVPAGYLLKKATDRRKDQSYFLYRLDQEQLSSIMFPLAGLTKLNVRALAEEYKLPVASKAGSQEICFLPDQKNYRLFLRERAGGGIKPGAIVDHEGRTLGVHQGIAYYTIGQRQGLGIAAGRPLYITAMDLRTNTITVGSRSQTLKKRFLVRDAHFILSRPKKVIVARVRIRYNHKETAARIVPAAGNTVEVIFRQRQFAVTPGQSAVFYRGDTVIGGGTIEKVLD